MSASCDSELAEVKAELKRVTAEKLALAMTTSIRITALERELAAANAELALLGAAREESAAHLPQDDPAAHDGLSFLQDEYEALRAEYMLINSELSDRHADLLLLRTEKEAAQESAAAEIAALKATIARLAADRPSAGENRADQLPATPFDAASEWPEPHLVIHPENPAGQQIKPVGTLVNDGGMWKPAEFGGTTPTTGS